jgi:hypothetical protein
MNCIRVHFYAHKTTLLDPILNQMNPINCLLTCFLQINFKAEETYAQPVEPLLRKRHKHGRRMMKQTMDYIPKQTQFSVNYDMQ